MEIVLTHAINKINNDKGAQQQVGDERKESPWTIDKWSNLKNEERKHEQSLKDSHPSILR